MAIVTDQTITVHGVSVGISKPIQTLIANGDFTYAELSKFAIVGRHDFVNDKAGVFEPDTYSYMAGTASAIEALEKYPVINNPAAPNWDSKDYIYKGKESRDYDNYGKMVLVYNMVSSVKDINKNFNDSNTACIVTEFNPRLIKMLGNCTSSTVTANVGETGTYTYYDLEASINFVWMDDDTTAPFRCLCIQNFETGIYFTFPLYDGVFSANQSISGVRDSMYVNIGTLIDDYTQTGNKLLSVWSDGGIEDFLNGANYGSNWTGVNKLDNERGKKIIRGSYDWYYAAADFYINPSDLDTALKQLAGCGFYFEYSGTVYKPITTDGIVTGYTADLSKNGQWDLINDVKGNTVPDTPSGGGGDDDEDDYADMGIGTGGNVGGLTSYAIMSINDLADLIADFNARLETGQSVVNNFICCYKLGPLSSFLCTTGAHNIIMSAYSTTGNNFVSTRADYAVISSQKSHIKLGTFTVPRKTGTFYDFAPYSTYELFIPCCGWVPLPDSVAGRDIQVYLVFDLASCVCKGIVRSKGAADGTTIAEISGVIGSSVPFYVNDSGLARASLVTGVTQTLGNAAMGVVGGSSGNGGLAVMGISNAVQSAQQTSIAGNTNYTAVRGGNGDMSAYANGEYCTIKITHPVVDPVVNDSMFGHTVGYLCEEVGQLSNFHGFTVCANPHVHINATSAERDEITQLLEQGVILPYGE